MAQDDTNTSCPAGDPLDLTRSIIDRDIARLEERIRALKSRRNELSLISCLPAEILCRIFSLIEDKSNSSISRSPKSWTNFSRVSQHWRSLALNAPELWTNIPLSYPRWAKEMLIRSKKAKLTIRSGLSFEIPIPKNMEIFRLCLHELSHVEEIDIFTNPRLVLKELFLDIPKSAPQLHTLSLKSHSFSFGGTAFSIPEDFLYDTERLRHVSLINCKIGWDSRFLTGLTRLTLEDSLQPNSSIVQLLHALQRMPALTDLHLKNSIPDDSESPSTYLVVDLPCLRALRISSGIGALTTVLRHITFPNTAILILSCKETQSTQIDTHFSNLFSVLASKFLSSLVIRSLSLKDLDDTQGLEICLWTTTIFQDYSSDIISTQSQLQLTLTWPPSHLQNHVKALTCAFDVMNLSFLVQLQISTMDHIDSKTWVKTFGKLPLLDRVCVQRYATHSFFEALVYKRKDAEKSKSAYRIVSFPKLRYISIEGNEFDVTVSDAGSMSIEMLLDCLMERCDRDAEIQVLQLDDCYYLSYDEIERIEEIVVDVIWDEVEQEISTNYDSEKEYDEDGNTIASDDYDDYGGYDGYYDDYYPSW